MRIIVISAAFPPMHAGEADHALHLCERLAQRGEEVSVLTGRCAEASGKFSFEVDRRMSRWSWSEMPRLADFLRQRRPEAILLLYTGWVYNSHPMTDVCPGSVEAPFSRGSLSSLSSRSRTRRLQHRCRRESFSKLSSTARAPTASTARSVPCCRRATESSR